MERVLKWIGMGVVVGLLAAGFAWAFVQSGRVLDRTYPVKAVALEVPTDAAAIEEGRRLAAVHTCTGACHGMVGEGAVMFDEPPVARLVAPDLTRAARTYTTAQFEAAVRQGVRPDGRSLFVMPSESFHYLSDGDLVRILAFLRSVPLANGLQPGVTLGPVGRIGVALGKFRTAADLLAEGKVAPAPAQEARGYSLALTACGHCHGMDFKGDSNPEFTAPDLHVVGAYSPEAFKTLLRTGKPLDARKLRTMGTTAQRNLSHLTDDEIAALYRYLHDGFAR